MLLYELTRLVEEGRRTKDQSTAIPAADLEPRRPSPSELELWMGTIGSDALKQKLKKA